jgi:hypothetical protein
MLAAGCRGSVSPLGTELRNFGCCQLIQKGEALHCRPVLQLLLKKELALLPGRLAQMTRVLVIAKCLDRVHDFYFGFYFGLVRIGRIFECAGFDLSLIPAPGSSRGSKLPSVGERSLEPFRTFAATMIDVCLFTGRVVSSVDRKHRRLAPCGELDAANGHYYIACTIFVRLFLLCRKLAILLLKYLVDLVGIEPSTRLKYA